MSKKNRKKKKIDTSPDTEGLTHNPFANLLQETDLSDLPEGPEQKSESAPEKELSPPEQLQKRLNGVGKVVLRKERKGRGGRTVTLIEGVDDFAEPLLEELASQLKKALGTGATLEEGTVVLQGDQRDRANQWLSERGVKKIVV